MALRLTIGPERLARGRPGRPLPAGPPAEPAAVGAAVLAAAPAPRQRDLMVVASTAAVPAAASGLTPAGVTAGAGWDLPELRGRHAEPGLSGERYQRERIAAAVAV